MNPWVQLGDLLGSFFLIVVWVIIIAIIAVVGLAIIVVVIAALQVGWQELRAWRAKKAIMLTTTIIAPSTTADLSAIGEQIGRSGVAP